MNLAAVDDLAKVEPVLEQMGERSDPEAATADGTPSRKLTRLAADAAPAENYPDRSNGF
jgi:hypothetical protein